MKRPPAGDDRDGRKGEFLMQPIEAPDATATVLAYHHAARRRTQQLPLARLSPAQRILIWGLRVYVLGMVVVVGLQVQQAFH